MYTLNIGLNNNPFDFQESVIIISNMGLIEFDFQIGVYDYGDGILVQEPTLVAKFSRKPKMATLCRIFEQECIPVFDHSTSKGDLVYHSSFKGERYQFCSDYFLHIGQTKAKLPQVN